MIEAGRSSNFGAGLRRTSSTCPATLDAAVWGAELALGADRGRIYLVEPTRSVRGRPQPHRPEVPRQHHPVLPHPRAPARRRRGRRLGGPPARGPPAHARQPGEGQGRGCRGDQRLTATQPGATPAPGSPWRSPAASVGQPWSPSQRWSESAPRFLPTTMTARPPGASRGSQVEQQVVERRLADPDRRVRPDLVVRRVGGRPRPGPQAANRSATPSDAAFSLASSTARSLTSTPVTIAPRHGRGDGQPDHAVAAAEVEDPAPAPAARSRGTAPPSPASRRPRAKTPDAADQRQVVAPHLGRDERLPRERHRRVGGEVVAPQARPAPSSRSAARGELGVRRVADLLEGQPVRRRPPSTAGVALPGRQDLGRPRRRSPALPDREQAARPATAPCCGRTRPPARWRRPRPSSARAPTRGRAGCGSWWRPRAACRTTRSRGSPSSGGRGLVHRRRRRAAAARPARGARASGSTALGVVGDPVGVAAPHAPRSGRRSPAEPRPPRRTRTSAGEDRR